MKVQIGYRLTIASDPWTILIDALHLPGIGLVAIVKLNY